MGCFFCVVTLHHQLEKTKNYEPKNKKEIMELICRIIEQQPLREFEITKENGMKEKLGSVGFKLQSGDDTLFAEMVGDQAYKTEVYDKDFYYKVRLTLRYTERATKEGGKFYGTQVRINNIALL